MRRDLLPAQSHLSAATRHLWQASQESPPTREMRTAAELIHQAQELLARPEVESQPSPHG